MIFVYFGFFIDCSNMYKLAPVAVRSPSVAQWQRNGSGFDFSRRELALVSPRDSRKLKS